MTQQTPTPVKPQPTGFFRGPLQTKIKPPTLVWVAFWFIIGGSAIAALSLVLDIVSLTSYLSTVASTVLLTSTVGGVVGLALRVYIAFAVLRGYGPARIFLSVIAAFLLLLTFAGRLDPISIAATVAIVTGMVLAWLPESSRYFAAVTAARKAPSQS